MGQYLRVISCPDNVFSGMFTKRSRDPNNSSAIIIQNYFGFWKQGWATSAFQWKMTVPEEILQTVIWDWRLVEPFQWNLLPDRVCNEKGLQMTAHPYFATLYPSDLLSSLLPFFLDLCFWFPKPHCQCSGQTAVAFTLLADLAELWIITGRS